MVSNDRECYDNKTQQTENKFTIKHLKKPNLGRKVDKGAMQRDKFRENPMPRLPEREREITKSRE